MTKPMIETTLPKRMVISDKSIHNRIKKTRRTKRKLLPGYRRAELNFGSSPWWEREPIIKWWARKVLLNDTPIKLFRQKKFNALAQMIILQAKNFPNLKKNIFPHSAPKQKSLIFGVLLHWYSTYHIVQHYYNSQPYGYPIVFPPFSGLLRSEMFHSSFN